MFGNGVCKCHQAVWLQVIQQGACQLLDTDLTQIYLIHFFWKWNCWCQFPAGLAHHDWPLHWRGNSCRKNVFFELSIDLYSLFHVLDVVKTYPLSVAANSSCSMRKWTDSHGVLDRGSQDKAHWSEQGFHRVSVTEWMPLEGTPRGHPVPRHCTSRATSRQLLSTMSRWLLNISKVGKSTTSVGSLYLCLVTLIIKKCFLMFK